MSTPTPFLYQTRTLARWSLAGPNIINAPRYYDTMLRRHYSDVRSNNAPPSSPRFTIKRTSNMSGAEPPAAGSWTYKPRSQDNTVFFSNEADAQPSPSSRPFTPRTPEAAYLGTSGLDTANKLPNLESNDFRLEDGLGFDEMSELDEVDMEDPFSTAMQPEEIQDLTRKHGSRDSTITDQERSAFQKIFSDIFKRSNSLGPSLSTSAFEAMDKDPFERESEPTDLGRAKKNLGNILTTAMQRNPQSRRQMDAALEKYPPALRAAAAKAMGYIEDESDVEQTQSSRNAMLDTEALEALREPERKRVEGLMNAANTDFELMEIMEKEVFTLISKLGLEDASNVAAAHVPLKTKKKKASKKAKVTRKTEIVTEVESQERSEATTSEPAIDGVSPLALYGPLYPSYLLLGLRLLDRSFAKPSPLALSILPRIKSLGYISQILGGTTPLYNELLNIYRYRYDDFRGMLDLLNEMEQAALEFDEDTLAIVRNTSKFQFSIHRGEKGTTMKALWAMPEFAPNGFRTWREKIIKAIMEREDKAREHLQFNIAR
ncbi:hypothetical protein ONS95_014048 [Cadophora gregata]|uniref:uncharacterized protein n=1 Tax=Cadophora gregata TaxID=51156 RepID=UPI0026DAEEFD|nr:uncharacterized protein ONS95_014048 [Cadophora gregata]KAK0113798.1 hypothetical protein ONS96_014653 [Cadophora gregata f. sp. sojae]KAK0114558.1 hypothetical protein ONS95_014048 [Cadophora gregata]